MKVFIYKITRDFGFAPNPFDGWCTLSCCKPRIRKAASINDYVIGIGSKTSKNHCQLIYFMKVTEALTFEQYWTDQRFQGRKPNMNGSLKSLRGDNIYHRGLDGGWLQSDSHHSNADGSTNLANLQKDTSVNRVLISNDFLYFGTSSQLISKDWKPNICIENRDFQYAEDPLAAVEFINSTRNIYGGGPMYAGDPTDFEKTVRYNPR